MAINFETSTPKKLLATFKKAIDEGRVVTWKYDGDGDFIHTPDQWKEFGWLRPTIYEGQRLTLYFIGRQDKKTTKAAYGVWHGRFIESMLTHCDELFTVGIATAEPTNSDVISAAA
jgi:hypothetical protein